MEDVECLSGYYFKGEIADKGYSSQEDGTQARSTKLGVDMYLLCITDPIVYYMLSAHLVSKGGTDCLHGDVAPPPPDPLLPPPPRPVKISSKATAFGGLRFIFLGTPKFRHLHSKEISTPQVSIFVISFHPFQAQATYK